MKPGVAKTLILHIGANKTGSSAIQDFLRINAENLACNRVIVAPSDLLVGGPVLGYHVPILEHLRENIANGRKIVSERVFLLMRDIPDQSALVVSAENLSNLNGTHELFADAAATHDIRIVLYIRRQDELLLSSWQQWGSKTTADFWAWIVAQTGRRGNWRLTLEPWEELVGRDRITVRIYDRAHLCGENIVTDFLDVLGLSGKLAEFQLPAKAINPSHSEAVLDFVKGNPLLFRDIHDNSVYDMIESLTGNRYRRNLRESIITHEERLALLQSYAAVNVWVKDRYFPDLNRPLFTEPLPSDYDFIGRETLRAQKWKFASALIYALSRKIP